MLEKTLAPFGDSFFLHSYLNNIDMEKIRIRLYSVILLIMCSVVMTAQTMEQDRVLGTLVEELNYNMEQLRQKPVPAYFMSLRLEEAHLTQIVSTFGAAQVYTKDESFVVPMIRLGNPVLDNYKYQNQGTENPNNRNGATESVPVKSTALPAYREAIWRASLSRYDIARRNYEDAVSKSKTDAELEDKAPCFSAVQPEQYYEPALPALNIDVERWKTTLNRVSALFKECSNLDEGVVSLVCADERKYVVNTDGTRVVQNKRSLRLMLSATIRATDGMSCPLYESYFGFSEDELPSLAALEEKARDLIVRLKALREAPLADPYAGPAILSGPASGVFFHEIFGHRLESHRMKKGGETFKKMVGERVLPTTFNVYCDPTVKYYGTQPLNGYYVYDEEGTRGQRVHNVENGVLRNFLTGRIPIDGFPVSNGHGRASGGNDPVSRQSNLIIETTKPYTEAQLREALIKEARKQGKEYGYYFRTVTSGFTLTDYLNAFNVEPVEVYRIYVDGRKDELVRGVNLIGTPLSMFSNIELAGDTPSTFIGQCGAESGWVDVTASSPMIFVSKIETQRSNAQKAQPRIGSDPINARQPSATTDVLMQAMCDQMDAMKDSLRLDDKTPLPFLIDYRAIHGSQYSASASLGGLTGSFFMAPATTMGSVHMAIGDRMVSSQLQPTHRGERFSCGQELDYGLIRRCFWEKSDDVYRICINHFPQKLNSLKRQPLPIEDRDIPEMLEIPEKEHISPTVTDHAIDSVRIKTLVERLSAVFLDYPRIFNSYVSLSGVIADVYRVTNNGLKLRMPNPMIRLNVRAEIRCNDGSNMSDEYNIAGKFFEDLPDEATLLSDIREFCELLVSKSEAPVLKEYYVGPLMLEDEAVNEAVARSVVRRYAMASRDMYTGSGRNSEMLGKRVVDTRMSVHQLSGIKEYKGEKLVAAYDFDADGVESPHDLTIIDRGIMRNLLCGNRPAIGALASTGNERLDLASPLSSPCAGIMHVTVDKAIPMSKMKAALISEARKAGLDHAFIVKAPRNGWRYLVRLDIKSGREEIVRCEAILQPSKGDLMHVTAASREEFVANKMDYNFNNFISVIAPKALIVETVEYNFSRPTMSEDFQLTVPAQR